MKTTFNIDDATMRAVKREAARRRVTMTEVVESALRNISEPAPRSKRLPPLPTFSSGGLLVDISNRDALYEAMESK